MGLRSLAAWQWQDYGRFHETRRNLLLHLLFVPLFLVGNLSLLAGGVLVEWRLAVAGLAISGVSFALQGLGHAGEANRPIPFTGPGNAALRIMLEQWVTFPRFVLSGGWWRNYRQAASSPQPHRRPNAA